MGDPFQRAKNDLPMKEIKHVDKSSRPAPSQAGRNKVPGSRCDQPTRPNEKGDRPSWREPGKVGRRSRRSVVIGGNGSGPSWPKVRIRACTPCTTSPSRSAVVVNNFSERDRNLASRQRRSKRHGDDIRRDRWDAEHDAPMGFLFSPVTPFLFGTDDRGEQQDAGEERPPLTIGVVDEGRESREKVEFRGAPSACRRHLEGPFREA